VLFPNIFVEPVDEVNRTFEDHNATSDDDTEHSDRQGSRVVSAELGQNKEDSRGDVSDADTDNKNVINFHEEDRMTDPHQRKVSKRDNDEH
jgi:hypothetical protein